MLLEIAGARVTEQTALRIIEQGGVGPLSILIPWNPEGPVRPEGPDPPPPPPPPIYPLECHCPDAIHLRDNAGAVVTSFTSFSNTAMENITFYLYDHLGNTRVTYYLRNCTSTVVVENILDYDPYGKVLRSFSNDPYDKERYITTQHERDKETGYDYRGARFYDCDIARFLSVEPLAKKFHSWSSYNYVVGNPVLVIDPDGRDTLVIHMSEKLPMSVRHTGVYMITFSIIHQGREIKTSIGGREAFYMISNTDYDDDDDNDLQDKEYYKLFYDKMSHHPEWKNTIRITMDGVFGHQGTNALDYSEGCKIFGLDLPMLNSLSDPAFSLDESIEALRLIREKYDALGKSLTGDKFLLKSNSVINHPEKMKSIELSQTSLEDIFNKREDRGLINHRSADKE